MMNELKEYVGRAATYAGADTVNHEGFAAWSLSDKARLEQLAMTGTLGRSFYVSVEDMVEDALQLLKRADADDLAAAIVKGRNEGFIRTFPLLGLVVLSRKSPQKFQDVFPQMVQTGNDLGDFIDLVRRQRGFGRSIKRAIHTYLETAVTPYYAMKYRRSLADAIRISRYRGNDPIYAYILGTYSGVRGMSRDKIGAVYEAYPEFAARRRFLNLLEQGQTEDAARVLVESNLDVDSLSAFYDRFDRTLWEATAHRTPVMRFLKYLAKFLRAGVDLAPIAAEKISVGSLQKAKVFPFRLYTAYQALQERACACDDECERRSVADVRQILCNVLDDYTVKYDWDVFNRYSWVIAPDVSGSMTWELGSSNCLSYSDVAAMFTGFFCKGLDQVTVLPWDIQVHKYDVEKSAPVIEHISRIRDASGGGTCMDVPVTEMIRRKIPADYTVFITDTEEYGLGWLKAWKEYRKQYPRAQAILIRLDGYGTSPFPEADAEKYGIWQIFGWNDSVIEYIRFILQKDQK